MSKGDMKDVIKTQINGELEMEKLLAEAQKPVMDAFTACSICEGFCGGETATHEERVEAWQFLINTGQVWTLQGWYGRTAEHLIEQGICTPRTQ